MSKIEASPTQELLAILKNRFLSNMARHEGIAWETIEHRLEKQPRKLNTLAEMERTGGEPDVIGYDAASDFYLYVDCSAESPLGRRSLCYDEDALAKRKKNPPSGSAEGLAEKMGIELLDEKQYAQLQQIGVFDTKSSSWIHTPQSMRRLGGALFGDSRYDRVFFYHNGADSYYASRGFRGVVSV
ncbi:MAG TPA: DUF4256 domain-containing protein [Sphaerochaeta sp.]|jgi:hypothetical protein|nr:DUF4256 domain-containing protein [Sphaerochaeta sp.]